MISALDVVILLAAGVLAGTVGSAGAITSLVSYPALLVVGVAPLAASVANIVAVTASSPGSALTSRAELLGQRGRLVRYAPVAAAGGVAGTALLLSTPADAFTRIVPFLVAIGSLTLLFSPWLAALRGRGAGRSPRWLSGAMFLVSTYNGYFGAGAGVMLLTLCLICIDDRLPTANALKNMLVGAATVAAATGLIIFGSVDWAAVIPLAAGIFLGGMLGPRVTRRLPAEVLRPVVAAIGLGLAIQLWISHGS
jgi:uncharacterized membrane protein YfcA